MNLAPKESFPSATSDGDHLFSHPSHGLNMDESRKGLISTVKVLAQSQQDWTHSF